ncbi:hypothetical protein CXB51_007508 [Gossypium anomalum]|uniref:MSP domain-containing protein n=1 Tax=Gossypium anomalum TaxID=47600 RepID=A0A8J6D4W7_9ROSI|nr:hypothetical protein CXB51_007508 [Gossypium anomalum]
MTAGGDVNQLISIQPNDLKFISSDWRKQWKCFDWERNNGDANVRLTRRDFCSCDSCFQLSSTNRVFVIFKLPTTQNITWLLRYIPDSAVDACVKTTSPRKYFVRPNTGIVLPHDSCVIRVTLQPKREYPPDMQCKDKFLLQSIIVPRNTNMDDLPADTFNKDGTKEIQECKLKVIYETNSNDGGFKSFTSQSPDSTRAIQHLKDERDVAVRQTVQLQQELDFLERQRKRSNGSSFSFVFASLVGLIGITVGFLLNLSLASPSTA